MYHIRIIPRLLHFKQPAGTSRGIYKTRKIWYLVLTSKKLPGKWGVGECAPLPELSCDASPDYEKKLRKYCEETTRQGYIDTEALRSSPSILFGLETAFRHIETGSFNLENTSFSQGTSGIPINGLIWMGSHTSMLEQIKSKITLGYRCIKLKIGAINFDDELDLLQRIRREFTPDEIELRVDANGAFHQHQALEKLKQLSIFGIHSIEQPIKAGQWEEMANLVSQSPIPIALDEELIGCNRPCDKKKLLSVIKPHYIILKPSLHGGISGSTEWIQEAGKTGADWWITSALESNIGLNAIAQWSSSLGNPMPQGLGTGALFKDNIPMPLEIRGDCLWNNPEQSAPDLAEIEKSANTIKIEGKHYSPDEILNGELPKRPELEELFNFLKEWFDDKPFIHVNTSGTTGAPKTLKANKKAMMSSALMTCRALDLKLGDTALLCMSLKYIGAKMMVIRSIAAGLNLIVKKASGNPLCELNCKINFMAIVPLQAYNLLKTKEGKKALTQIDKIIIGGGAIDQNLEQELRQLPNNIYSTYGMTETLSHIALRRVSGSKASSRYMPLPSVQTGISKNQTLTIFVPGITQQQITTNDIAEIHQDGTFKILGRKDNTINTGGIKIQPEQLESKLTEIIDTPFAITSIPDPKLGEAITLIAEKKPTRDMLNRIKATLGRYENPVHILTVEKIPATENGKIDRNACKKQALLHFQSK